MAVDLDGNKHEHWGCDDPIALGDWISRTAKSFKQLGAKIQAGELLDIESLGHQRHLSILSGDEEALGIGFTRTLGIGQIRETLKQIEAKWAY